MANEFIIKNGFVSKGNSIVEGNLSGQTFNIINTPVNNNLATEILVRNTTTGDVEYRNSSTLGGGGGGQTITGYTYNETNNTFSIGISGTTPFDATINVVSGLTVTNDLIVSGNTGMGTDTPTEKLHIKGGDILVETSNGEFYSDLDGTSGPVVRLGGNSSDLMTLGVAEIGIQGMSIGTRGDTEPSFPGYGKQGDGFLYSSADQNGLNIISQDGTNKEDYIRFYAGKDVVGGGSDIHIHGTGSTKGYVGINTENPTERLHVDGTVRIVDGTEQLGYVLTCDADGVSSWQPSSGGTSGGTVYWEIENGGLKSINQNAGSINGDSDGAVLVGGYFNSNNIYSGKSTTIINGNNNTISGGTTSAIISTNNSNIIGRNGSKIDHSVIVGGTNNNIEDTVSDSDRTLIIGGINNDINDSVNSAMLSTSLSTISGGTSNIILGGSQLNIIERNGGSLLYSSLIGGNNNTIEDTTGNSPRSTIIGGTINTMSDSRDSVILGSTNSNIYDSSTNAGIYNGAANTIDSATASVTLGGSNHIISGGTENAIIGGNSNKLINTSQSVILGGRIITGTTDATVYVPNLNIGTIGSGTSIYNLGLDANGFVVTGTTNSGGGNSGITGYTYDPTENEFAIGISGDTPFTTTINEMNGLTINGELTVTGDTQLDGDLIVEGLTTLRGQTTIGNSFGDSVDIVARVNADIVPVFDDNVSLGDDQRFWKNLYVHNITGGTLNLFSGLTTNNSGTEILVRNSSTGQIEKRDVSSITGGTSSGYWEEGGDGNTALKDNKGNHTISGTSDNGIIAGGFENSMTNGQNSSIVGGFEVEISGTTNTGTNSSEFSSIVGSRRGSIMNSPYSIIGGGFSPSMSDTAGSSMLGGEVNVIKNTFFRSFNP